MNNITQHQKGLIAVFFAAALWSTSGLFIKLISLNALQINFFRSFFAALVFLVLFGKSAFRINRMALLNASIYGAVLITFVWATIETTAANAIFLQYTAPIYVLILVPLLHKTRYTLSNIVTAVICFAGMLLFFSGELSPGQMKGNLIAVLSGMMFAGLMLGMRQNSPEYQYSTIFYGNLLISLICAPSLLSVVDGTQSLPLKDLAMVTYLGIFQIGLPYALFSYGLKKVLAVEASLISMVEPVLNPVWVAIGYGEIPSHTAIAGGLVILVTITVRTFFSQKAQPSQDTHPSDG